ncbi:MAG: hypothetical protein H6819_10135 [Phycisphaerales bacterium]|nr:hypothetical protein [Phycisphaerales bacterium]MCB9856573.1 hypothetical protein [Phycisphaerales bacterium]MCB9864630.1 hypothetical protein [Phycisphaerales bacterium]
MNQLTTWTRLAAPIAIAIWTASIAPASAQDCNNNGVPDAQDVDPADPDGNGDVSADCNINTLPDECELPGELQMLTADDGIASDWFGNSVSIDGDVLAVGTRAGAGGSTGNGAVYVFRNIDGVWQQEAKLTATDTAPGDQFGVSVCLDGDTLVVGAPRDDDIAFNAGSAYIFRHDGDNWQQIATLNADDGVTNDYFGTSVSISSQFAVVGAIGADEAGLEAGAAYVFREIDGVWQQVAKLIGSNTRQLDFFGQRLAVSGETVVVGVERAFVDGAAYVFRDNGGAWEEIAMLSNPGGYKFGVSVAIDSNAIVVGSFTDGSVFLYHELNGVWQLASTLVRKAEGNIGCFGGSVAIDGDLIVVGERCGDTSSSATGAAYVFRYLAGQWSQVDELEASDAAYPDQFGHSVAVSGTTIAVGAPFNDAPESDQGAAYVFTAAGIDCNHNGVPDTCDLPGNDCNGNLLPDECDLIQNDCNQNLIPDECDLAFCGSGDLSCADCNGNGVPDECDLDGNDCNANGIPDDCDILNCTAGDLSCADCNHNGIPDGCDVLTGDCNANLVPDSCEIALQLAKVKADVPQIPGAFGWRVAIDGSLAVVGDPYDSSDALLGGAIHIFEYSAGTWQRVAKLTASNAAASDNLGWSVAINGDTALAGSFANENTGAVYVFRRIAGTWQEVAILTADDAAENDYFGGGVAFDGVTAVMSAVGDDHPSGGTGSVYVFREVADQWQQVTKLRPSDTPGGSFGFSVAVSGSQVVVGVPFDDVAGSDSGSAYVFEEIAGIWQQVAKLTAADGDPRDYFALEVSIDAGTLAVGAPFHDGSAESSGAVYLFRKIAGTWNNVAQLTPADAIGIDFFGNRDLFGGAISVDGETIVIGSMAYGELGQGRPGVYVFREDAGDWRQVAKIKPADAEVGDEFGASVGVSGGVVIAGMSSDNDPDYEGGSAYFFNLSTSATDCFGDNVLDECRPDCNANGVPDRCDIAAGTSPDCNDNLVIDDCEALTTLDGFVAALLMSSQEAIDLCLYDADINGILDGRDVDAFVTRLLGG